MGTRLFMTLSSVFLALLGVLLTFAPQEILSALALPLAPLMVLILQLGGALYLGSAFTNWTARGAIIGGIYARPLSLGNLVHFVSGTLTIGKVTWGIGFQPALVALLFGYAVFAAGFAYLVFGKGAACVTTPR